jgi:hypothetical protein
MLAWIEATVKLKYLNRHKCIWGRATVLEQMAGFEFLLDTEKAEKHYFFNSHITKGCFKPNELEYFYHKYIAKYLQMKLAQPESVSKLPREIRYICFDEKVEQENFFMWKLSVIVDDETFHELYKLSNIKLYYRMIPPEEELEEVVPLTVEVIDR